MTTNGTKRIGGAEHRLQILLVGVGGQGVLTASKVLGEAAHLAGLHAMVGQLHGMSQRGGSVECSVLIGPGESSFIIGPVDAVVAFEPLEALRALPHMARTTRVLMNQGTIAPPSSGVPGMEVPGPKAVAAQLRDVSENVTEVDGPLLLEELSERRTLNMIMLGALAGTEILPFDTALLWEAISRTLSPGFRDQNRKAFDMGERWTRSPVGSDAERRAGGDSNARSYDA